VYVPASDHHGPQELRIGEPGDIYVRVTATEDVLGITLPLSFSDVGQGSLWPGLTEDDITYLPGADLFELRFLATTHQDGVWPDTVFEALVSYGVGITPGTYDLMRFTVVPTAEGVVQWTAPTYQDGDLLRGLLFATSESGNVTPEFFAADITILPPDCNANGVSDPQDIANGTSTDCNDNGVPDECEPDCNENGTADECDILFGVSGDCNGDGVPDECDLADGSSFDVDGNHVPDECDDCNGNGFADGDDIVAGRSQDCNANGRPDECDIRDGISDDVNANGIPDECEIPTGNALRVYVPAGNGHWAQQMIVGQPEDVYVQVVTEEEFLLFEIPLEVMAEGGDTRWAELTSEDVCIPADSSAFGSGGFNATDQDGIWSDTMLFYVACNSGPLPPGTHEAFRFTVVPTAEGTIRWAAPTYQSGEFLRKLRFLPVEGEVVPGFIADDIQIITSEKSAMCCDGEFTGNTDCDPYGRCNLADITTLIDRIYVSHTPLCCEAEGNTNGDPAGKLNLADITALIDYVYVNGTALAPCP